MSSEPAIALAVAGVALLGVCVTGYLARRSSREATQANGWAALTAAHQTEMQRLSARIGAVEKALEEERRERRSLAEVLRSAWGHIIRLGDQIRDLGGHPEPPPSELTAFMRQDGLVVDRVETTISRTTVTDTRDHEPPLEQVSVEMHPTDDA